MGLEKGARALKVAIQSTATPSVIDAALKVPLEILAQMAAIASGIATDAVDSVTTSTPQELRVQGDEEESRPKRWKQHHHKST